MNLIDINSAPRPRRAPSVERLTPRERQVVGLTHLRNADIAALLGISLATVKTLIARSMEKTGTETRTQLALLCLAPCETGVAEAQTTTPVFLGKVA